MRLGLEDLDAPILGAMIGVVANVIAYGVLLFLQRDKWMGKPIERIWLRWQILAGIFVTFGTWARWVAVDLEEVAVALALGRVNVPVVLVLSVFLLDRKHERITPQVWLGAGLIVAGSVMLSLVK